MDDKKYQTLDEAKQMFYVYDVMGDTFAIGFDYNKLINLPTINTITVKGDLTWEDLGLSWLDDDEIKEICKL